MIRLDVSRHAKARMRQRGLRHEDVQFVCEHGTETAKGYLLTERDAESLEAEARHMLLKAQRLRGVLVPVAENTAKTVIHTTRRQQRRLL